MKVFALCALAAVFSTPSQAVYLSIPEPTQPVNPAEHGWTPKPTGRIELHQLFRRSNEDITYYGAPDRTCGFLSGTPNEVYTCTDFKLCALAVSKGGGVVGCCDNHGCQYHDKCLESVAAMDSSICDSACQSDRMTLKCSNESIPYCNTATFHNGASDYWCDSSKLKTAQGYVTRYSFQSGPTWWTSVDHKATHLLTETSEDTRSTASTTTKEPAASATSDDSSGGTEKNGNHGKSTGAIVGGVVGGIGALGLVGIAAFLFLRQWRKDAASAGARHHPSLSMEQGAPVFRQAGYDPDPKLPSSSPSPPYYAQQTTDLRQQSRIYEAEGEPMVQTSHELP